MADLSEQIRLELNAEELLNELEEIHEELSNFKILDPACGSGNFLYLSFRELPFLKKLVVSLESKPTILMIDGNGLMHPYGFGIASHVGVSFNTPSIGVAKSMLCGKLENNVVKMGNKKIGYALFSSKRVRNPIYVSPGHNISFETSLEVVRHLGVYKNPEPLRRAHILATTSI